ncbi:MAG TPA: PQQ-binding-like beta-propeller repeat protein, partial [Pirellulaceae bacterium]|nr:PQQ-binding-like beta-propeller repeat protein [Pirellulaceae bacterium]
MWRHSRRIFLVTIGLAAVLLAAGGLVQSAAPEPAGGKNWPIFRGDATSSGVAHTTLPVKLDKLWEFKVEGGAFDSTAAIVDGVVYIGDMDGELRALNLADGKEIWTFPTDSGFLAAPAVKDGLIYIGDIDGKCYCIDAKSGKEKWIFSAEAEVDSSANFWKENVLFASQDRHLYCLDAKSGKEVWRFAIDDQIRCTPTVVEDRCFLAGCDGKLHIVDLTKGEAIAAVPIDAPTGVTPAVLGDRVFFGTQAGVFFAINWKEAKIDWKFEDANASQPYASSAAVTEKIVVVGSQNR